MSKRVLDVGNCAPDHAAIRSMFETRFDAVVIQAHGSEDALESLRSDRPDLVLVNRKLDRDYSDGLNIIKQIKADPELSGIPCMLISNYEQYQHEAVQAGAINGFGKAGLEEADTLSRIADAFDAD